MVRSDLFFASAWLYWVVPVSGVANVLHQLTWCPLSFVCGRTDPAGGGFIGTATRISCQRHKQEPRVRLSLRKPHEDHVGRRFRISPKEIQAASSAGGNPYDTFVTIQ